MTNKATKEPKKISRKKQVHMEITETLTTALAGLKDILGEKKFETRIDKAAKLLGAGIKSRKEKTKTAKKKGKSADRKEMINAALAS